MSFPRQQLRQTLSVSRSNLKRKLICDAELPTEVVDALWNLPDDRLLRYATPLQEKDRCAVLRCDHPEGRFLLKSMNWGVASRSLRMLLREPIAHRCAAVGIFMLKNGIRTPRPRACLIDGWGPFSHRSYLLTDFVDGASLFHRLRLQEIDRDRIVQLAEQFVALWEKLICFGISHNDLKPENLIVDETSRLWMIDLEKVCFHKSQEQLRQRHSKDLKRFFHVRSWRDQPQAAEIFRQRIAASNVGKWLSPSDSQPHRLISQGYSPEELQSRISVAVVADRPGNAPGRMLQTIASVQDLADEISIVAPDTLEGQFLVRKAAPSIQPSSTRPQLSLHRPADASQATRLNHSWILVLRAGECATPNLVRWLPERILREREVDAFAVPIEECVFGYSTRSFETTEIRLFNQDRCRFSLDGGELSVEVTESRVSKSDPGIKRLLASCMEDYVALLNEQSERHASARLQQGQRPRLIWGLYRAGIQFARGYLLQGTFRSGWIGLQFSAVNSVFVWIEEAKLWQFTRQSRRWDKPYGMATRTGSRLAIPSGMAETLDTADPSSPLDQGPLIFQAKSTTRQPLADDSTTSPPQQQRRAA